MTKFCQLFAAALCCFLLSCESKEQQEALIKKNEEIENLTSIEKKLKKELREAPPKSIIKKLDDMKEREQKALSENNEVELELTELRAKIDRKRAELEEL